LPTRYEQLRPLGEQLQCDTAVWIDEVSTHQALVQVLAIAPGRMSLRSIEVNLKTQTAADTAIVVNELLALTDTEMLPSEPRAAAKETESSPVDTPIRETPVEAETENEDKPDFSLFATMETDAAAYDPFGVMLGGGLEGCMQSAAGWGGCLLLQASGKGAWRISDVEVSAFQFRPGIAVYFSKRVSRVAFGPRLGVRPVLQSVKAAPSGFATEREVYLNGLAALFGQGRLFLGRRLVLQLRLGAAVWFRTLTFTRQSTAGTLFKTPVVSPHVAVSLGAVF
jgi:hypothetical protein